MSSAATLDALPEKMTREQFLAFSAEHEGTRFERSEGFVFAMAPERAGHAIVKSMVWLALHTAVKAAGKPCQVFPDGMTVRVGDDADYEPDALVRCGPPLPMSAVVVPDPIIVVEVLSPGTRSVDLARKLLDYFCVPTVMHYLILEAGAPKVLHYVRVNSLAFDLSEVVTGGSITLDHPGITIHVADIYGD